MNVLSDDQKSVTLIPSILALNQTLDMTLYVITDYMLENSTSANAGIRMKIRMKRKILSEMMTTYFPSLLLMMITYATTFFKPFFFEAALSVNLTTMLVMTTIFISKMESLPPTSDIKMIDCWLILCQLVPFAQVVLLTTMEYLRGEEQEKQKKEKHRKRKRNRNKMKRNGQKKEKEKKSAHNRQSITSAWNTAGGDLNLDLEIEQDKPLEASTPDQYTKTKNTKTSLLTQLIVVGKYLTSASIY